MMPSFYLDVRNSRSGFSTPISSQNYDRIIGQLQGRPAINILIATLIPVRTNYKSFASDFFLPTFANQVLKINHIGIRILVVIPALLLDIITLPIRLVTSIPRAIYNSRQGIDPLYGYLRSLDRTAPNVQVEYTEYAQVRLTRRHLDRIAESAEVIIFSEPRETVTEAEVNFIEVPDRSLVQWINRLTGAEVNFLGIS